MTEPDDTEEWLATLPPTARQTWSAFAFGLILLAGLGVIVPFAAIPLPRVDAFIPSFEAVVFVTDFITSALLFSQFSIYRSRAILALGLGYLFTALIVVPHLLTFPGAFSPAGLLGAGLQSTAWLYWFWHIAIPAVLLIYAILKDEKRKRIDRISPLSVLSLGVALIIVLVCGLTWLATAGDAFMPRISSDRTHFSPLNRYVGLLVLALCLIAFAALWARRRSVLDEWLLVVAVAAICELGLAVLFVSERFTLGFYVGRVFSLTTSTVVLVVLLAETTKLYAHLARSNMALQRERQNKLINMEAMAASISHEVRQPLSGIAARGGAALRFLGHTPPNFEAVRSSLKAMVDGSHRASQILDSLLALFGRIDQGQAPVDINVVVAEALRALRGELTEHGIATRVELAHALAPVMGNQGQLHVVIVNLVSNAIEAMDEVKDVRHVLQVSTSQHNDAITVVVEDSGPGIDREKLDRPFDTFVTTKPRGMGLGLAICRMIIERHAGQLLASQVYPHGTVFRVVLPRMKLPQ